MTSWRRGHREAQPSLEPPIDDDDVLHRPTRIETYGSVRNTHIDIYCVPTTTYLVAALPAIPGSLEQRFLSLLSRDVGRRVPLGNASASSPSMSVKEDASSE